MNELVKINETIFESIKHVDDDGNEYWYARELQYILGYNQWRSINDLIKRAKVACKESDNNIHDHFAVQRKMVDIGSNTQREVLDYKLSRYACYLIVMNGNPKKEIIALAQTYFAIQTRKQELLEEEYNSLTEDEKRFYQRDLTKKGNYSLNQTIKKVTYDLDNMGSDELIANLFRISQTNQSLNKDNIQGEKEACLTHNKIGKIVRKAIKDAGGIMPENLPTTDKSLMVLEKENKDLIIKKQ